jgi:hypothetical protein
MTLATHAITGAAVASFVPQNPFLGFALGFASHFAIDAIPHYDYPILSDSIHPQKNELRMKFDRLFFRDAVHFTLDACVGIAIAIAMAMFAQPHDNLLAITLIAGSIGGILPDPLQFVSKKIRHEPLTSLQRFHKWIHADWHLRDTGHLWTGIISQSVLVALVIVLVRTL